MPSLSGNWPSSPLFALIIGINKYQNEWHPLNNPEGYPSLDAAVPDADMVEAFLLDNGVPPDNIVTLRDEHATRQAIIGGFHALANNDKIEKNEAAMLIYYAGHGSRADVPPTPQWQRWHSADKMIEMLCPADMGMPEAGSENKVEGIPDRTVAALLNRLSRVKGDNITIILDCCCSAGATRDIEKDRTSRRFIPKPPPLSPDRDILLWGYYSRNSGVRSAGVARWFAGQSNESHVLLAACGRNQGAQEYGSHGCFTAALFDVLHSVPIDQLTYTSLMDKIQLPKHLEQTPHCEGRNVYRRLFNKHSAGADSSFILGGFAEDKVMLLAGAAQGITVNSIFSMHSTNFISESNPQLGVAEVVVVGSFTSVLCVTQTSDALDHSHFYAKQTVFRSQNKIRIYSADSMWLDSILRRDGFSDAIGAASVGTAEAADILVLVEKDRVFFERRADELITPYIGPRLQASVRVKDVDKILQVLQCAIRFHRHLTRESTVPDDDLVRIELNHITTQGGCDWTDPEPQGPNLIDHNRAVVVLNGEVEFVTTIHNHINKSWYPYIFYFDPARLSIEPYYLSPVGAVAGNGGKVDAPLLANQKLTLGYGDGGVPPWALFLEYPEQRDVGFFKVFLTSSPTSFSSVSQSSPFGDDAPQCLTDGVHDNVYSRHGRRAKPRADDFWRTQIITIVQKNHRLVPDYHPSFQSDTPPVPNDEASPNITDPFPHSHLS